MSRRALIICYIMLVWFVISFVTNLIGPLMPIIIGDFHEPRAGRFFAVLLFCLWADLDPGRRAGRGARHS
jgi:hypothetical protein